MRKRNKNIEVKVVYDRKHIATKASAPKRKLGTISIEVYYNARRVYFTTGIRVYSDQFRNGKVVNHGQQVNYNERIRSIVNSIENFITDLQMRGESFDFDKLKEFIGNSVSTQGTPFLDFIEKQIAERTMSDRTRMCHTSALKKLREWNVIKDFSDVTVENIIAWHSVSIKAARIGEFAVNRDRVLRVYAILAYKLGLIANNPYEQWRIPDYKPVVSHKFVSLDVLDKLRATDTKGDFEPKARDLFLFQCNTGMSYIDTQKFDITKLSRNGTAIAYYSDRIKTHEPFYVPLTDEAKTILTRYGGYPPKLTAVTYNYNISKLGKRIGLHTKLSSHWARHTFAMIMLNNGMPIEVLAKMLGHARISTTQIYARIQKNTVDTEFDKVIQRLKSRK